MRFAAAVLALFALAVAPAHAQFPQGFGDARIQLIEYRADQVFRIEAAVGYQVTVELAPDEQIQTVAVGDTSAWSVMANKAGDRLFVKPLRASGMTNMTVVTTARSYSFELAGGGGSGAYTLRFRFPPEIPQQPPAAGAIAGKYRLSGDRRLWPDGVHDDGTKTFIEWGGEVPLPAVYVIDRMGRELLANGQFREGLYVIDGIERQLVFRIDRYVARATRYIPKKSKS